MNKHGQSIIEFTLIAVLVILGIVVMGPYVLRSVGAHFKLWDEGVQDSYTENLNQVSVNNVPYIPTKCTCQQDTPSGCGSTVAGSQCGANQRFYYHNCNPQGCDGAPDYYCKNDPLCCAGWANIGCGTAPCPANGCSSAPTTLQPPLPGAANNCYFGQEIQGHQCGDTSSIKCVYNPTCPLPTCLGILSPGALYCATNGLTPPGNLLQNNGISYVANKGACPDSPTCELYCSDPYRLNASGTGCTRTFQVAPTSCPQGAKCRSQSSTQGLPTTGNYQCSGYESCTYYVIDMSFQICPTDTTIGSIDNPTATPDSFSSGACACCFDDGSTKCLTNPSSCNGQAGATPGTKCNVDFTF